MSGFGYYWVMAQVQNRIRMNFTDPEINSLLKSDGATESKYTKHYSQSEEFFLKLGSAFFVPSFPIHHDVRNPSPSNRYLETLKLLLNSVVPLIPELFRGLTYYFDPADTLRPGFFQRYRLGDKHYLYLLKIDLTYKANEHDVVQPGTNDSTPEFRSSKIFLEGIVIPLESVEVVSGKVAGFSIRQTVSQTWIGETGRGYFVQGIWMDYELTKFFSKLFVPTAKKTYPFYPFQCRYRTICSTVIETNPEQRNKNPPLLHRAVQFVAPVMDEIQEALKDVDFSEELAAFTSLKRKLPEYWENVWNGLTIKPYLNERDMKEFLVEH